MFPATETGWAAAEAERAFARAVRRRRRASIFHRLLRRCAECTKLLILDPQSVRRSSTSHGAPGLRALTRRLLEDAGYTVIAAPTGAEAIRLLEDHHGPLDLLVTDIVMPGMRGPELASRLRDTNPEMAIVFISGDSDQPSDRDIANAGFLTKPFRREALLDAVAALLASRQPEHGATRPPSTGTP